MKNFPRLSIVLSLALGLPGSLAGCETKTRGIDSCGDGFVDPGEDCDGPAIFLQTCGTLGYYDPEGDLACAADCTWDTRDCGGHCGDGFIEDTAGEDCEGGDLHGASCVSLNYTNGGTLSCDSFCHYDTSDCQTVCGNGNVEPGETCDDGNLADDDGCAGYCQVQDGWRCDDASPSVCVRICTSGLTACGPDCLDLFNDPLHCGACDHACDEGVPCIGGVCRAADAPWDDAGSFGLGTMWTSAPRYDLADCVGGPFLYVQTDGAPPTHAAFQLGVNAGQWSPVSTPPLTLTEEGSSLDPGLAAACLGTQKIIGYSVTTFDSSAMELAIRRYDEGTMSWTAFGAAQLTTECGTTTFLDLQPDPLGQLHVLSAGGWLCPDAVDYAWWDGAQWQAYPTNTGDPRQLTHNATGRPSMAWWNQANDQRRIFAVARSAGEDPDRVSEHRVLNWQGTTWGDGVPLDEDPLHDGWGEDISLASSDSYTWGLCAAWTENVSVDPMVQEPDLYVKCYDGLTGHFLPIGNEALVNSDHRARSPHLVIIGNTLWLAYLARETDGPDAYWHVRVVRHEYMELSWEIVATGLEDEFTSDSENPQLLVHDGQVFLSFVELTEGAGPRVHIKKP